MFKGGIIIKTTLFIDIDGVIFDSISAFCKTYSHIYQNEKGYIKPKPTKVNCWNFADQCPLLQSDEDVEEIFSDIHFFKVVQTMPGAIEALKSLNDKYNIILCSIGTLMNLSYKSKWIRGNLPFIKNTILINNEGCKMNKSIIKMQGGIFIDDCESNLLSSDAETKICFGNTYKWNENWQGTRLKTWKEVGEYLL